MQVLKRNGQLQDFNIEKVKTSIECTSNDINQPLTASDINQISNEVEETVNKKYKNPVDYRDIHNTVVIVLKEMGFSSMAKSYDESENSFVHK